MLWNCLSNTALDHAYAPTRMGGATHINIQKNTWTSIYMYMHQHSTNHSHHFYQPHIQLTTIPTIPQCIRTPLPRSHHKESEWGLGHELYFKLPQSCYKLFHCTSWNLPFTSLSFNCSFNCTEHVYGCWVSTWVNFPCFSLLLHISTSLLTWFFVITQYSATGIAVYL